MALHLLGCIHRVKLRTNHQRSRALIEPPRPGCRPDTEARASAGAPAPREKSHVILPLFRDPAGAGHVFFPWSLSPRRTEMSTTLGVTGDLCEGLAEVSLEGAPLRPAEMRGAQHVGHLKQRMAGGDRFFVVDVERRVPRPPFLQRGEERTRLDELGARGK